MRYREIVCFVFSIVSFFVTSCGSDNETQAEPKSEWKGDTSAFTENFELRGAEADSLLYEKSQKNPFSTQFPGKLPSISKIRHISAITHLNSTKFET